MLISMVLRIFFLQKPVVKAQLNLKHRFLEFMPFSAETNFTNPGCDLNAAQCFRQVLTETDDKTEFNLTIIV